MALQTNHTTDGFHCRPGVAGRQNNPLKYTGPGGYVELYSYWDGKASGGHGSSPVLDMNPYFTMGGAGAIGPGSGKPWSDPNRSKFGNFMLMVSSTFDGVYGQGLYNRYLEDNGFLGKNGHWEITYAELSEENDWVGFESDENSLQGINVTAEFVERDESNKEDDWLDQTLDYSSKAIEWLATATRAREFLELEYIRQAEINIALSGNYSQTVKHSMKAIKAVGKITGVASMGISWADYANNPTTGNFIQATANTGLVFVRVNPITGIIIGVADVTGASDYVYDQIGGFIDDF